MDHTVQAQRELEIPVIKEIWEKKSQADAQHFHEQKAKFLQNHRQKWERDYNVKNMLMKMGYGKSVFEDHMIQKNERKREAELEERNRKVQEYLKKRLPEYEEEVKKKELERLEAERIEEENARQLVFF